MTDSPGGIAAAGVFAAGHGADTLRRLRGIIESSSEAMAACDLEGRVLTWNAGAAAIFGHEAGRIVGRSLLALFPESYRGVFACLLDEAAAGRRSELFRTVGTRADGRAVDLSVTLAPMRDADDGVEGVCMVARDVSARRRAEEQAERDRADLEQREAALREALAALRASHEELKRTQLQLIRAAKLESVGRLAAGVAHEVKNPLAIVLAGTEYLGANTSLDAGAQEALHDIRTAVERAGKVIGGLLNYSSASEVTPTRSGIHEVVEQALALVHYPLERGHVRIVKELAPNLPLLSLDVVKIEQVLINLMMNALDAMPQGGTLTVRTLRRQLSAAEAGVGVRRSDLLRVGQSAVLVEIEDTGTGIAAAHLARVFDPFFTTKPAGKGTGLGLAVSRTIVAMHGGTIWLRNRPQGGTVATVVLRSFVS